LYEQAKKDEDDCRKREIGTMIVAAIQRNGGRFLHLVKGPVNNSVEWVEMSDDKAFWKVMATMRDEVSRWLAAEPPTLRGGAIMSDLALMLALPEATSAYFVTSYWTITAYLWIHNHGRIGARMSFARGMSSRVHGG
jgi:hypothetical protein